MNNFLYHKVCLLICCAFIATVAEDYEAQRNILIDLENKILGSASLNLTTKEQQAQSIFLDAKIQELNKGIENAEYYAAGKHFFKAKDLIEKSKVFKFLRKMPKGALLHVHLDAAVSSEWVINNLTYMPGLKICTKANKNQRWTFREDKEKHGCVSQYVLMSDEREKYSSQIYDKQLEKQINLYTPTPEADLASESYTWNKFQQMFETFDDVLSYKPAFQSFFRQFLQELFDDNIMYAEVRVTFRKLYDERNKEYPVEEMIRTCQHIVKDFRSAHPDFLGVKLIFTINRCTTPEKVDEGLQETVRLQKLFPSEVLGFDLVGREEKGESLHKFYKDLENKPKEIRYFFHAGETNWFGTSTDLNLIDVILLGTTRIGHGVALMKHPSLRKLVKEKQIAIEVSPISNQVLGLIPDLRNHPGAIFISEDIPIVICNDDPGFWNAKGLSYDMYYTIMSMAPKKSGLKILKKLVFNSINYSVLSDQEKETAREKLDHMWKQFIDYILKNPK